MKRLLACTLVCLGLAGCGSGPHSGDSSEDFERNSDRPPSARTLYSMARVLESQDRDDRARPILAHILHNNPEFVPAYCAMAEIEMRARHVDEAIDTLNTGLKVAPNDPVLHNDVGMCRVMKQEYTAALKEFTKAASSAPANTRYRANMAMALGMQGRYEEAFALYSQIMPPSEAHYNLAVICEARKDATRASDEFRQAKVLQGKASQASNSPAEPG